MVGDKNRNVRCRTNCAVLGEWANLILTPVVSPEAWVQKKCFMFRFIAPLVISFVLVGSVRAEVISGLYNTGVTSSGILARDSSPDPHYTLVNPTATAFVADSLAYPFVPNGWLPDGPLSKWIDPLPNQSIGNPPGYYTYETTFQLAGGDPTGVVISGQWSIDNIGANILINGHSTGIYYDEPGDYSFNAWSNFILPSTFFVDGINTLEFITYNTDNGNGNTPTGLRVEMSVQLPTQPPPTTPVPESSSFYLFTIGILSLAYWQRRRKQ